ncbi:ATP-grasp fold amidoligase family protein [Pseudactinotalea sp. Z1748]|uniref:ATP-grasp fold amidoligase family protein n=1 Tax=Pseudactinotalea sp. Z1748 TaxID=3413027 RepID=UPI003C7A3667
MLRRLGPLAWRDARIAELESKLRERQERLDTAREEARAAGDKAASRPKATVPSWHARIMEQQRVQRAVNALNGSDDHPRRNLFRKLHNYEVARSHGVATPRVLEIWPGLRELRLDSLPDEFVLKSNGGSTGRGVLPLERTSEGFRLVDGTRTYSAEEVMSHFTEARGVRPPYFAETLLPGAQERLPDDIKIYAFYGEIAYVMVRRMPAHADVTQGLARMVTPAGEHLEVVQRFRPSDASVPVPDQLPLMVETARALSLAVPLPFIRVDLYAAGTDGVILGELTPLPGNSQTFTPEWGRRLGEMYDQAEARLQVDLTHGRPYRTLYGEHDRDLTTSVRRTTTPPQRPNW